MRIYQNFLIVLLACFALSCGGSSTSVTPFETLKAYSSAIKKKDAKMMKFLLSKDSLKIHQDQANAQNLSLDEIILQETLFSVDQRVMKKRNEKIEGDTATIEIKNSFDTWDMIYFVKEDGIWKIDKKGFSDNTIQQNDADNQKLEELMKRDPEGNDNSENAEDSNSNVDQNNQNQNSSPNLNSSPNELNDQDDRVTPLPKVDDQS